jgi:hypothetical protein
MPVIKLGCVYLLALLTICIESGKATTRICLKNSFAFSSPVTAQMPLVKRERQKTADNKHKNLDYHELLINQFTAKAGLSKLTKQKIQGDDIEVRLWRFPSENPIRVFRLQRKANVWRCWYLVENKPKTRKVNVRVLPEPKDGWNRFWDKLTTQNILNLPICNYQPGGMDASALLLEISAEGKYRKVLYDSSSSEECAEARKIWRIFDIFLEW